jgi:hypothetical protein
MKRSARARQTPQEIFQSRGYTSKTVQDAVQSLDGRVIMRKLAQPTIKAQKKLQNQWSEYAKLAPSPEFDMEQTFKPKNPHPPLSECQFLF